MKPTYCRDCGKEMDTTQYHRGRKPVRCDTCNPNKARRTNTYKVVV